MDVRYPNANGSVRRVRQAAAAAPPAVKEVRYKECGRNLVPASGGHVVDGCREWMPLIDCNPADPFSYKCAACGCHRNFHRQETTEIPPPPPPLMEAAPVLHGLPRRREETPEDRLPGVDSDTDDDSDGTEYDSDATEYDHERFVSPPPLQPPHRYQYHPVALVQRAPVHISSTPHMLRSLNSSAPGALQGRRLPAQLSPATAQPPHRVTPARKRHRTTFTTEQKQGMMELAERLGWRLRRHDRNMVDAGCRDIGISRRVFRDWMHNKKRKGPDGHSASASAGPSSAAGQSRLLPPPSHHQY
ncbi:zinc-finger homeodomain 1 [Hordeum vulgare]|nr:zinc-finger homeodomain 1 [Hordeum vulgare]